MHSKADLMDLLADAITRRIPDMANHKSWFRSTALDIGINYDTFRSHATGQFECSASTLLNYFDHFGPEFEREIRGTRPNHAEETLTALILDLESTLAKHRNGNGSGARVLPMKGKIS